MLTPSAPTIVILAAARTQGPRDAGTQEPRDPGMQGALSGKARDRHAESRRTRSPSSAGEIGVAAMLLMGFATPWGTAPAIFLRREAPIRQASIQQKGQVERTISAFSASPRAKLPFPTPHAVALGPRCREDDGGAEMWWTFLRFELYVIYLANRGVESGLTGSVPQNRQGLFSKKSKSRRIMLARQRPTEARRAKQPWPYPRAGLEAAGGLRSIHRRSAIRECR